ncbi:P-loop containing nucleoside triphosphate hydrolase protein [Myriangium duriaei CBS 260.36]|uniref:P-loop containing nucleoside triphosphate hydrolase protein n=1 Tax=Myriangium duriaei CBS 260.36 TaxID=1168546 RepID=A0A9P4J6Q6_9PEZI|nr:P-loop containing nucleoside triphosphate hydrolase protein [Myriangium duriaei CBS 260.36]
MEDTLSDLTTRIQRLHSLSPSRQLLIGIAGPPGSGKSTLATALALRLSRTLPSAVLSLDGFHLPRAALAALPDPATAFARRGAPWTFDVPALLEFVKRLKINADLPTREREVVRAPGFDHAVKDPVQDEVIIPAETAVVILEHLYLLLNEGGWRDIATVLDIRVMVDVERGVARERVARRHVEAGIEESLELGRARYDANDALNGELIREKVVGWDILVQSRDAEV